MAISMKKIGLMTSGGDAPGMNAAIRAVVRTCAYHGISAVGIEMGYQGLIDNQMNEMGARDVKNIIHRGGTVLRTARCKAFYAAEGRAKAYENFKSNGLDALIVIGGDGTFTGAMLFSEEFNVPVVGLPGTIDNDIFGTDTTIGYDTALNTVVDAIDKIRDTATSHNRLFFVEVMGRDSGFLALNGGIGAGAQDILIPEEHLDLNRLFASLDRGYQAGKSSSIIVVSEGEEGGVFEIVKRVREHYPDYDMRVTVLGHLQRGGAPSCSDRVLASRLGVAAVEGLMAGQSGVMAGLRGGQVVFTPLSDAVKKNHEIDAELIRISDILAV
ncbi:ATP-dependent 6-phosphofructokinase 1 [Ephemeroptericola cinctiostellae]|uniref:ATP-dependent 6-phosphofructokinase n=2 Tax=Ephemeroptericola cinctiostellae TaxID=2268024 RepID=A0A345DBJ5_9BURK|nr:ATP-dependent 6-phosphofructokinase 1 [Ephemeroptericola cinctiostellae]